MEKMAINPDLIIYAVFFLISLLFILLWAGFFYFYSPRKTTPRINLFFAFLLGIISAGFSFFAEQFILSFLNIDLFFLQQTPTTINALGLLRLFFINLFFVALVEESIKFIFLKKSLETIMVDQVIDGMKIGIWVGFGFVFVENAFYFLGFYAQFMGTSLFITLVLLRGIFSVLAHALYGAIMGYYLSLAKFNRLYGHHFLRRGFITNLLLHGFFNFFLIINLGLFSVIILILILIVTIIWYNTKKNLDVYILAEGKIIINPPILSDRIELETLLSRKEASAEYFRQLLKIFPPAK